MPAARTRPPAAAQQGLVTTEFALLLPMLLALFLLLVEAGHAMKVYYTLFEASRDGARLVLSQGDETKVDQLVRSLAKSLPASSLQSVVTKDNNTKTVSVELVYAYRTLLGNAMLASLGWSFPTLRAKTTMPLP